MACHWNATILDVIVWHLFWLKKTSKFYGKVMTFWWNSKGFLWEKGIPVKCHENVMKFQCHSMGLKMKIHFDGIFMEKAMELSWNLTSFSTKSPMGWNDGILLWGLSSFSSPSLFIVVSLSFSPVIESLLFLFVFWELHGKRGIFSSDHHCSCSIVVVGCCLWTLKKG